MLARYSSVVVGLSASDACLICFVFRWGFFKSAFEEPTTVGNVGNHGTQLIMAIMVLLGTSNVLKIFCSPFLIATFQQCSPVKLCVDQNSSNSQMKPRKCLASKQLTFI